MIDNKNLDERLNELLKAYKIEGDIDELYNLVAYNSQIAVSLRDISRILSGSGINYIRTGYGETLAQAYKDAATEGNTCKLVSVFCPADGIGFSDFYNFIKSIGENVIFGYTKDCTMVNGVKLVMIFN